jgi:tetratricopeptide (TPR) repeat protein
MNKNKIQLVVGPIFENNATKSPEELSNRLIAAIEGISKESLTKNELEDYYYLLSSSYFKIKNYIQSFKLWEIGAQEFPNSSRMNYGFGQALIYTGQIDKAVLFFNKINPKDLVGDFSLQMARYMYLWGRPEEGFRYLKPLFNEYMNLGSLDDTFLYMRKLPFFSYTWHTYLALLWIDHRVNEAQGELMKYKHFSDYDFAHLQKIVDVLCSGV